MNGIVAKHHESSALGEGLNGNPQWTDQYFTRMIFPLEQDLELSLLGDKLGQIRGGFKPYGVVKRHPETPQ